MAQMLESERRDFWEICEEQYQTRSTVLTLQLPVAQWHEQIGDGSQEPPCDTHLTRALKLRETHAVASATSAASFKRVNVGNRSVGGKGAHRVGRLQYSFVVSIRSTSFKECSHHHRRVRPDDGGFSAGNSKGWTPSAFLLSTVPLNGTDEFDGVFVGRRRGAGGEEAAQGHCAPIARCLAAPLATR